MTETIRTSTAMTPTTMRRKRAEPKLAVSFSVSIMRTSMTPARDSTARTPRAKGTSRSRGVPIFPAGGPVAPVGAGTRCLDMISCLCFSVMPARALSRALASSGQSLRTPMVSTEPGLRSCPWTCRFGSSSLAMRYVATARLPA